ncbi:MAG: LCP family protein [Cyanobacteriota bacterium]
MPAKTTPRKRASQSSPKNAKDKKAPQNKWRWGLAALGLTSLAVLSAAGGALLAFSLSSAPLGQTQLSPEEAAVFEQESAVSYKSLNIPELSRPVNILILGTKVLTADLGIENPGYQALVNSHKGLSDTILLVRLDPEQKKLTALSIPRDTQVEIEGKVTKINEANLQGGPALAATTVEALLGGVAIDRYLRVNVQAVEKLIDALGGVSVYVPKDLKYQDDSQHLYIDLKQGQQHLNGDKALQLLRYRKDNLGDIGRIQRQQLVMRALIDQALKPQTLLRIPQILSVLQTHLDTNLSLEELVAIAGFAAQQNRSDVQMLMLPGDFNSDGRAQISYWLPDGNKINALMEQYFAVAPAGNWTVAESETREDFSDPSRLRIAIQNNSSTEGAATELQRRLAEAGYNRAYVIEDGAEPVEKTRIIVQKGDNQGAAQLRRDLGMGEILVQSTGHLVSDITIQIGADWSPSP